MKKGIFLAVLLSFIFAANSAFGNERVTIPPPPYAPIYLDWYGDDDTVAFIFYRPSECVPGDFNLYDFFDIPGAFFCVPLTVDGFAIYEDAGDLIPSQYKVHGLGELPVWFVSGDDYDAAIDDGDLLFSEVESMPSLLKGHATFYKENRQVDGVHPNPKVNIVAYGMIDGTENVEAFWLHVFWKLGGNK